jgi:hypothetical protein
MPFLRKGHLVCRRFPSKQGAVLGTEWNGNITDMDSVKHCDIKPLLFNGNKGLGMRDF